MKARAIIILALFFVPSLALAGGAGRVLSKSGSADWRPAANSGWTTLERGDHLPTGATLRTGNDGALRLLMTDRSILSLGPSSKLSLDRYEGGRGRRKVNIKVTVGLLWARVTHLFGGGETYDIESRTAVAGVRGTDLVMVVEENGDTDVTCIKGSIQVGAVGGDTVIIGGYQRAQVGGDGTIRTKRLTAAQIRQLTRRVRSGQLDQSKQGDRVQGAGQILDDIPAPEADTPRAGGKGRNIDRINQIVPTGEGTPPIDLEPASESGRLTGRVEVRDR